MASDERAVVERPQLRKRLQAALSDHRLVVLQAPLGYGKTSAIGDALRGDTRVIVRYDAAPWDAESFVEALIAAVRTVRPEFGRRTLALFEAGADPRRIGSAFASDLNHVDLETVIVIDDAHLLGETFGGFIDGLFRDAPRAVSWLISTRTSPPFALADLILRDSAAIFLADDLRFDPASIQALASRLAPGLDEGRMREIETRTEGWPAGVVLSLRTGSAPLAIAGGAFEGAGALLVEQLLRTFAADELDALEQFAVYDVITDAVIETSPDSASVRAALNRLEDRGAMISRSPAGALRVHPMLRDVIVKRLARRSGDATIRALHGRAATFYAQDCRIAAALFHLEAARDASITHAVLLRHGTEAIERGHGEQVARLAQTLRASGVDDPALVAYLAGWRAKQGGDDRARERFAEAVESAEQRDDRRLAFSAGVEVVEHDLARGRDVSQETIAALRRAAEPLGDAARATAEIRAGWHAAIGGRFANALRSAQDAIAMGSSAQQHSAAPLLAYALTVLGDFSAAEHLLASLMEGLQDADSLGLRSRMLGWSARLALMRGDTRGAYADALEGFRSGAGLIAASEGAAMHIALAEAATHAGDVDAADTAVAGALQTSQAAWYELDRLRFPALASIYGARSIYLRSGARAALRTIDALLARDMGAIPRAMALADSTFYAKLAGDSDVRFSAAVEALASAIPMDAADATVLNAGMAQLTAFADRTGIDRASVSISMGPYAALQADLATLERRGVRFESRLADALGRNAGTSQPIAASAPQESLTPREAEILELLALGLTNKEVAQRLVLGTRTVETHVSRILGKLGVNSRSRAIATHIRRTTDAGAGIGLL